MSSPLHLYLLETLGEELLCEATLVIDNPRSHTQRLCHETFEDCAFDNNNNNRSVPSLHSLPSLTSDSSISRWDSSPTKTRDCLSPPQRRPRRRISLDRDNWSERKLTSPRPATIRSAMEDVASSSYSKFQSPSFPRRRASFMEELGVSSLPPPPCWDDSDEDDHDCALPSPISVRAHGLEEILGKALEECEDCYSDDSCYSDG